MSLLEDQTASFIVRVWRERGEYETGPGEWRGSIEHVQSGRKGFFRDLGSMERFMAPLLQEIGIDASQRFWEQISPAMFDTTANAAAQPSAVPAPASPAPDPAPTPRIGPGR
ncbi:hypothetical protein GCM10007860_30600 [Chitiniphilus shinanonensis]|uniref:Uncharacterized protein n=1 Tax=Chitiniphilus shinanonensis TaxID=553088 RepID=A0ABQ6C133_9NEIS|nr:hypothetical protein [Chitiniphilus shinanonensis]GLS05898.1 hypothetical protein GCM10007860_30600 [Chitiniphilus shinanonensis]